MEKYISVVQGDSREILDPMDENLFDSLLTDPPYELSITKRFANTSLDDDNITGERMRGRGDGYARLASGFMGMKWDGTGIQRDPEFWAKVLRVMKPGAYGAVFGGTRTFHRTMVALEDAGFEIRDVMMWLHSQGFPKSHAVGVDGWEGWGSSLKPSYEPIILIRKPCSEKSVDENILKWGVGAINIADTRIPLQDGEVVGINRLEKWTGFGQVERPDYVATLNTEGRWPANVLYDETVEDELENISRYFYCTKAPKSEKQIMLDGKMVSHPTSKPLTLLEYLVKLIVPKDGVVLDPFAGGFSTAIACMRQGRSCLGIELEEQYINIGKARLLQESKKEE